MKDCVCLFEHPLYSKLKGLFCKEPSRRKFEYLSEKKMEGHMLEKIQQPSNIVETRQLSR